MWGVYIGMQVIVACQPLINIFSDRAFENIRNLRLFNFKERALMYKYSIKHLPGKVNAASDYTSHYPAWIPSEASTERPQISSAYIQRERRQSFYEAATIDAVESIGCIHVHIRA